MCLMVRTSSCRSERNYIYRALLSRYFHRNKIEFINVWYLKKEKIVHVIHQINNMNVFQQTNGKTFSYSFIHIFFLYFITTHEYFDLDRKANKQPIWTNVENKNCSGKKTPCFSTFWNFCGWPHSMQKAF